MRGSPLFVSLLLGGCAVGPNFMKPVPPDTTGYMRGNPLLRTVSTSGEFGGAQRFVGDLDIPGEWWTLFHSQPLNELIDRSLKANPNLTAAQAALRQARENALAQKGAFYPQVTGGLAASRNLTPVAALSPAGPTSNPYYSLITPQLNVSFVPDVFGANRRAVESLDAQAENLRYQYVATYLTLTSNVVTGALQEASLRGQIGATEETIRAETDLLGILRRQYELGQVSLADVAAQEAALAQARLALPPLQKQLEQQRDSLIALSGGYPSQDFAARFQLAELKLPEDLPVSLPSKLIDQRPDVREAEETLHSASAQIGVAIAARIPQITLTADIGNSSSRLSQLFTPGTNFWSLAGGITGSIFDGFTLLHKQRAAEAGFDQAAAQYKNTVITALQNVADALYALRSDADALNAAVASEQAAGRSLAIVRKQLELGQVAYLAVLNAEQTYQQSKLALVQAQAGRLSDTAGLFQALGGGWWNRPDMVAEK
jgi:NodT family efflux transporter outer membrane factor (OMF) lipoprotein